MKTWRFKIQQDSHVNKQWTENTTKQSSPKLQTNTEHTQPPQHETITSSRTILILTYKIIITCLSWTLYELITLNNELLRSATYINKNLFNAIQITHVNILLNGMQYSCCKNPTGHIVLNHPSHIMHGHQSNQGRLMTHSHVQQYRWTITSSTHPTSHP